MLKLDIKVGESIAIGNHAVITLEDKSGKIARIAIKADKSVPITRLARPSAAQIAAEGGITGRP